jgi:restriction system protein
VRVWLVRAGRHGEREQFAIDHDCALVGWQDLGDLSQVADREELIEALRASSPDASDKKLSNHAAQLGAFLWKIEVGDVVVLPLKSTPALALGRVTGAYAYRPEFPADARHTRPVEWLRTDLPRSVVGQDLLYSLGAFLTVCEIKRNGAASRFSSILSSGKDPGAASLVSPGPGPTGDGDDVDEETAPLDVEQVARDQVRAFIAERFTGHDLARLVEAILRAQGFFTYRSPAGADGGIDVLAGGGPLGMEPPRICVQVKSGDSPVDVKVVRELQGVLSSVNAKQGLLVAWAGLTKPADTEARSQFFRIRVWTADDVIEAATSVYDALEDDVQAELPLKRIWIAVPEVDA